MDKVAIFKGEEIAREKAVQPKIGDKFNTEELREFYNRVSKSVVGKYDNSSGIEFFCQYVN